MRGSIQKKKGGREVKIKLAMVLQNAIVKIHLEQKLPVRKKVLVKKTHVLNLRYVDYGSRGLTVTPPSTPTPSSHHLHQHHHLHCQ